MTTQLGKNYEHDPANFKSGACLVHLQHPQPLKVLQQAHEDTVGNNTKQVHLNPDKETNLIDEENSPLTEIEIEDQKQLKKYVKKVLKIITINVSNVGDLYRSVVPEIKNSSIAIGRLVFAKWNVEQQAVLMCQIDDTNVAILTTELNLAVCVDPETLIASLTASRDGLNRSERQNRMLDISTSILQTNWKLLAEQKTTLIEVMGNIDIYPKKNKDNPIIHLQGILNWIDAIQFSMENSELVSSSNLFPKIKKWRGKNIEAKLKNRS